MTTKTTMQAKIGKQVYVEPATAMRYATTGRVVSIGQANDGTGRVGYWVRSVRGLGWMRSVRLVPGQ